MSDQEQAEMEARAIKSIGAMLADMRWSKATAEQRRQVGKALAAARKAKKRGRKK